MLQEIAVFSAEEKGQTRDGDAVLTASRRTVYLRSSLFECAVFECSLAFWECCWTCPIAMRFDSGAMGLGCVFMMLGPCRS
jgi:hypothetical protein